MKLAIGGAVLCIVLSIVATYMYTRQEGSNASAQEASAPAALPPSIWWFAPLLSSTGFGSESRAIVHGLVGAGRSRVLCTQHGDSIDPYLIDGLRPSVDASLARCFDAYLEADMKRDAVRRQSKIVAVCHSEPGAWHVRDGALYNAVARCPPATSASAGRNRFAYVGRTMFESANVTKGHASRLRAMDEVWVPSQWQRDVFIRQAGVDARRIFVVPEPVDGEHFRPASNGRSDVAQRCRFVSIHKWEHRKGWPLLLEAFARYFADDERVELVLKTRPPPDFDVLEWMRACAALDDRDDDALVAAASRVAIDQSYVDDDRMRAYYAQFDAFVLATRGEGWGRGQVEAMAMAMPVVSTRWSGPSEYMSANNSFAIELDADAPFYEIESGPFRRHLMANPSIRSIGEQMRRVVDEPAEALRRALQARRDMLERYSPLAVAAIIQRRVSILSKR
jgi:glycosyltransferase involved in cell wall biosynthesis